MKDAKRWTVLLGSFSDSATAGGIAHQESQLTQTFILRPYQLGAWESLWEVPEKHEMPELEIGAHTYKECALALWAPSSLYIVHLYCNPRWILFLLLLFSLPFLAETVCLYFSAVLESGMHTFTNTLTQFKWRDHRKHGFRTCRENRSCRIWPSFRRDWITVRESKRSWHQWFFQVIWI